DLRIQNGTDGIPKIDQNQILKLKDVLIEVSNGHTDVLFTDSDSKQVYRVYRDREPEMGKINIQISSDAFVSAIYNYFYSSDPKDLYMLDYKRYLIKLLSPEQHEQIMKWNS